MSDHIDSRLRPGEFVEAAYAIVFRDAESQVSELAEGVELVMAEGRSVLLWNETNWNLATSEGAWPELPAWAWPPGSWDFVRLVVPGGGDPGEVLSVSSAPNQVGEINEVCLEFQDFRLVLISSGSLFWRVIDKKGSSG